MPPSPARELVGQPVLEKAFLMKRSAGVTVIAALALVGSAVTLLMGVLTLVIMMFAPIPAAAQGSVPQAFMKGIFFVLSLMYLLPAVWGLATGIGLIRLKNWARISTIVFSVLLIVGGCFGGLIIAVMPFPSTPASNVDPAAMSAIRIAMVSFWLALPGIGLWWLVFFTRTSVKAQFLTAQSPSGVGNADQALPGVVTSDLPANSAQRGPHRPLSITIIAWVLLAGCILSPLNFLLHTPAIVLTKMLTGWAAIPFFLTLV